MTNESGSETARRVIRYNLNPLAIGLLFLSGLLWLGGYADEAVLVLLGFLLVLVVQNVWLAYTGLTD